MQHFVSIDDCTRSDLTTILAGARSLREQRDAGRRRLDLLAGRTVAMVFEKPSLRTRVSFEQAVLELGGDAIVMSGSEIQLNKREPAVDVARVLAGMVDAVAARVFEHEKLTEMAAANRLPVINLLSDQAHPCQAIADVMTMQDEFGEDLAGRRIAFVGDGNNVARSLASLALRLGCRFSLAAPESHRFSDAARRSILGSDVDPAWLQETGDPVEAVRGADVVYTDTWTSMGQEQEKDARRGVFQAYQLNTALAEEAADHAIVLHCLPAYRGEEITAEVLEGPRSRVFGQAHNRLHAQKGMLAWLLGQPGGG